MPNDNKPVVGGLGPRLWLTPAVIVTVVMAALAALYLGGTVNSTRDLNDFPVAVVNADTGATDPSGRPINVGEQISDSLRNGVDDDKFALRFVSLAEAEEDMGKGKLYGAIVLPSDLSGKLVALTESAVSGGAAERPEVTVYTNPLANTSGASIFDSFASQALNEANQTVGRQLLATATQAGGPAASDTQYVTGSARIVLSEPMLVNVTPFKEVPNGTGGGISAFYYALLLVLAGFTGSLMATSLVDSQLGFTPSEIGPLYHIERHSGRSRLATLALKWGIMTVIAVLVSSVYLGIANWIGMPLDHPWELWLFSVLSITAVAVVAQAILALLGSLGMVFSLFLFIVLSIPSSGGTTPLEAMPPIVRFLSSFEPMHQIYLGTRSILYFGATWDSGLARGVLAAALAIVLGLLVGALGTHAYDLKGLTRKPSAPTDTGQ
ncbi:MULTISPECIES: YhgE/Pip domain-containing protein [Nocardia]|uniref:YhgE/Pip domain-containing protein n=1 Tax=Nocardia TaxID=1817 RepID=UPI002458063C|nr:ABC transporter permease [Nocardia neocaledoniensis]